jgi:hypothetical protein
MKKLAIGCGIVLLVLLVVGGIAGYVAYTKFLKPMAATFTEFAQLSEIEKEVKNTTAFSAPGTGELTEEMVARFVKVQEAMQARLGGRMEQVRAKYEQIDKALKAEGKKASFRESLGALKELSSIVVDAKRAQVEALNQASFSVKEYEWVRQQVYAAVGMVAAGFDVKDVRRIAEQAAGGAEVAQAKLGDVPERNRELVKRFEKQLREWAPLAFFGL